MNLLRIAVGIVGIHREPSPMAECISEALYGEQVAVLHEQGQWLEVVQHHDQYRGFIDRAQVRAPTVTAPATHWVQARSTLLFIEPDMKSRVMHRIPFLSQLRLTESSNSPFCQTDCGYYVWKAHCLPTGHHFPDTPLALAQRYFLGMPYRWGGRSPEGADCSGLVQLLAHSQGLDLPRDSGDQEQFLAHSVRLADRQRGDLVYWPGHVGILTSPAQLLHSTAHTLTCLIEPLDEVITRAGPVSSIKRLFKAP